MAKGFDQHEINKKRIDIMEKQLEDNQDTIRFIQNKLLASMGSVADEMRRLADSIEAGMTYNTETREIERDDD